MPPADRLVVADVAHKNVPNVLNYQVNGHCRKKEKESDM